MLKCEQVIVALKRVGLAFAAGLLLGASINFATYLEWPWIELGHVAEISNKIITWPFVVLCGLLILMFVPSALRSVPLSTIDLFGTKLEFSKDKVDEVSLSAGEMFSGVGKKIDAAFQLNTSRMELEDCFRRTMEAIRAKIEPNSWPENFRATLHVVDIVYGETLYQLIDYFPRGGGKGRRKSIRFGIIGLAFRSEQDQLEPNLQTSRPDLIKGWGMTGHEAAYAGGKGEAFACFVLRAPGSIHSPLLGLLYMDAKEAGPGRLFKSDPAMPGYIGHDIRMICDETKLLEKLASLKETMKPYATNFQVHS